MMPICIVYNPSVSTLRLVALTSYAPALPGDTVVAIYPTLKAARAATDTHPVRSLPCRYQDATYDLIVA